MGWITVQAHLGPDDTVQVGGLANPGPRTSGIDKVINDVVDGGDGRRMKTITPTIKEGWK